MNDLERNLFNNVINTWGVDAQSKMMVEECSELITAIQQFYRGRTTYDNIAEEIADVIIMSNQMTLIVGEDLVNKHITHKMTRLEERLNKYKENIN